MTAIDPATVVDVHAVAGDEGQFGAYLTFLAENEVFMYARDREDAVAAWWTSYGRTNRLERTALDRLGGNPVTAMYSPPERALLVAFTWPNPTGAPVPANLVTGRIAATIRADTAAVYGGLCNACHGLGFNLAAVLYDLGRMSANHLAGIHDAGTALDAQTLLQIADIGRIGFDHGWFCDVAQVNADLRMHGHTKTALEALDVTVFLPDRIHAALGKAAVPPAEHSKYRVLFERLDTDDSPRVTLSLNEIEDLVTEGYRRAQAAPVARPGRPETPGLPPQARAGPTWWANASDVAKRPNVRAWTAAGYQTTEVSISRSGRKPSSVTFAPMPKRDLWAPYRHALRAGEPLTVPLAHYHDPAR